MSVFFLLLALGLAAYFLVQNTFVQDAEPASDALTPHHVSRLLPA